MIRKDKDNQSTALHEAAGHTTDFVLQYAHDATAPGLLIFLDPEHCALFVPENHAIGAGHELDRSLAVLAQVTVFETVLFYTKLVSVQDAVQGFGGFLLVVVVFMFVHLFF